MKLLVLEDHRINIDCIIEFFKYQCHPYIDKPEITRYAVAVRLISGDLIDFKYATEEEADNKFSYISSQIAALSLR